MKIKCTLVSFLLCCSLLSGQNVIKMLDHNFTWNYYHIFSSTGYTYIGGYFQYLLGNDTLVDGQNYRHLWKRYTIDTTMHLGFLREDSLGKVYYRPDELLCTLDSLQ